MSRDLPERVMLLEVQQEEALAKLHQHAMEEEARAERQEKLMLEIHTALRSAGLIPDPGEKSTAADVRDLVGVYRSMREATAAAFKKVFIAFLVGILLAGLLSSGIKIPGVKP